MLDEYGDLLFDKGLPGMDVDINISSIVSHVNGLGALPSGIAVALDADRRLTRPAAGSPVVGITVRHPVYIATENGQLLYPPHAAVPVMEFGRVWAICQSGCSGGEPVTTNTDGNVGVGGAIAVEGAFWDSKADAGGIAVVRLNRIQLAATPTQPAPPEEADDASGEEEVTTSGKQPPPAVL